jgi:hypothetical protein
MGDKFDRGFLATKWLEETADLKLSTDGLWCTKQEVT